MLGDLVAGREVRVEIMFPIKEGDLVDLTLQGEAGQDGGLHTASVEDREGAGGGTVEIRHGTVDGGVVLVGSSAEYLTVSIDLSVDFQSDHALPLSSLSPASDLISLVDHSLYSSFPFSSSPRLDEVGEMSFIKMKFVSVQFY